MVFNYLKKYPVTSLFFMVNSLFLLMTFLMGGFTASALYTLGSFEENAVLSGEWYRFITSMFLHGDMTHFLFNMAALLAFAIYLEEWLGKVKYFVFYILCGILSGLPSLIFIDGQSVGASGALFGVLGFFLYISTLKQHLLPDHVRKAVIQVTVLNLVLSFLLSNINASAHIGGLAAGFLLAVYFSRFQNK